MRSLRSIFHDPPVGSAFKWRHYFPVYEGYFEPLRQKPIKFLEIGIFKGGSLWMWKSYFENSKIVGIDINPDTKVYEGEGVSVCVGDQTDEAFLREVAREHGPFDIILDDGGHKFSQQITSLTTLFEFVNDGGLYIIEDLQNSYMDTLYKKVRRYVRPFPPTIEFLKKIIDAMHFRRGIAKDPLFSETVASIHFYEGMAVIEKGRVEVEHPIRSKQYWDADTEEWVDAEVDDEGYFLESKSP